MRTSVITPARQFVFIGLVMCNGLNASLAIRADQVNMDNFVVHTEVFVERKKQPIYETETIFSGTKVYDTISSDPNGLIAKFDLDSRVVWLLDRTNRIQSTLSFKEISQFQAGACAVAVERGGLLGFLAQPQFTYEFDPTTWTIRLTSPWMTYEAVGQRTPVPANVVGRFIEFADWTKQLATMLDHGSPAQARIELNKKLKDKNFQVVRVTSQGERKAPELGRVTSEHNYRYDLNETDRNFMRGVEKDLKVFDKVSFAEFRRKRIPNRVAAK